MKASVMIRVSPETRNRLNRMSAARGISAGELVEELAGQAEGRAMLEAMEAHYVALRADSDDWANTRSEIAAWGGTAADGLSGSE